MRTSQPVPHWPLAATISPGRLHSQRLSVRPWLSHVALTWQLIRLVALQVNGLVAESMDDEVSALLSDVVVAQCEASVEANLSLLGILFARSANESRETVIIRFDWNVLLNCLFHCLPLSPGRCDRNRFGPKSFRANRSDYWQMAFYLKYLSRITNR